MSVAVTYTVRNEARTIQYAISYHRAIGVKKFFVFLDGSTDQTERILRDQHDVVVLSTNKPGPEGLPFWAQKLLPRFETTMDVRKRLNTLIAGRLAAEDEIEWLACIDVDELMVRSDLKAGLPTLDSSDDTVDQILMRNLEVLPVSSKTGIPFLTHCLFLKRLPVSYTSWRCIHAVLVRAGLPPRASAWATHLFYRLRCLGALPRLYKHPLSGELIPGSYYLGYDNHKSIIRVKAMRDASFDVHAWRGVDRKLRTTYKGKVLHYDLPDAESFVAKFSQRSRGSRQKSLAVRDALAGIVEDLGAVGARDFFEREIRSQVAGHVGRLRKLGLVVEIQSASSLLSAISLRGA